MGVFRAYISKIVPTIQVLFGTIGKQLLASFRIIFPFINYLENRSLQHTLLARV